MKATIVTVLALTVASVWALPVVVPKETYYPRAGADLEARGLLSHPALVKVGGMAAKAGKFALGMVFKRMDEDELYARGLVDNADLVTRDFGGDYFEARDLNGEYLEGRDFDDDYLAQRDLNFLESRSELSRRPPRPLPPIPSQPPPPSPFSDEPTEGLPPQGSGLSRKNAMRDKQGGRVRGRRQPISQDDTPLSSSEK